MRASARPADSLWHKVLGLFANLKGEFKYAADRSIKKVEYRLERLSALIELVNKLLNECNRLLRDATGCEWLFIGEEFDRPSIRPGLVEDFFLNYSNIITEIRCACDLHDPDRPGLFREVDRNCPAPASGCTSSRTRRSSTASTRSSRRDVPPLQDVLEARVSPKLFGPGQMKRLIVASGGNLRDLFTAWSARRPTRPCFAPRRRARSARRTPTARSTSCARTIRGRLGVGPYDAAQLTYEQKAERLVAIYNQEPDYDVPDPVLYSLLNARAVQEFNGERWFGVHPLVVDILKAQGRLKAPEGGKVPGGTE